MICRECKEEIKDGIKFCPFCGALQILPKDHAQEDMDEPASRHHFKEPRFKTNQKTEDPVHRKKRTFRQRLLSIVLALCIALTALFMIALRINSVLSSQKLFEKAAYLKDGILYVDTDITGSDDAPLPIDMVDDTLLDYGMDDKIAAFTEDGKTLYFLDKDTGDGSGRLEKIKLSGLGTDMADNANHITTIANFVVDYDVLSDGSVIYRTNENEAGLYNGHKTVVLSENVVSVTVSENENYAYCLVGDEQETAQTLVRITLNRSAKAETIAKNVEKVSIESGSRIVFMVRNDAMTTSFYDMYLIKDNKDAVKIATNMTSSDDYEVTENGIFYAVSGTDKNRKLYDYTDTGAVLIAEHVSETEFAGNFVYYQKEDDTQTYYTLNGDEHVVPEGGEVVKAATSSDGRYVLLERTDRESGNEGIYSYRSSDGTLSSEKEITGNGELGSAVGTTVYYSTADDSGEIDLYSFHNENRSCVARDVGDLYYAAAILSIYDMSSSAAVSVFSGESSTLFSFYDKSGNTVYSTTAEELRYAGKNAVIYEEDSKWEIGRIVDGEYVKTTIVSGADALILPQDMPDAGIFLMNASK